MNKKILLLGASGQVGFELNRSLQALGSVLATARSTTCSPQQTFLDLNDPEALNSLLLSYKPDMIVNASAWTAVDLAETESAAAFYLNETVPASLAQYAKAHQALLVHYSTDYVFNGHNDRPWKETDDTQPLGVYGLSKRAGEERIQSSGCHYLIFRTAWVYASRGHNFLLTMLKLARNRPQLSIVSDQIGTPTSARLIADFTQSALLNLSDQAIQSIYHLTANGQTSWFDFAKRIFEKSEAMGILTSQPAIQAIPGRDYPTPAARPDYSVLDTSKFSRDFNLVLPQWEHGLGLCLEEIHSSRTQVLS